MSSIVRHRPSAPLDRYVECFWWSQREIAQGHREHMLPSGQAHWVFALHETPIVCWQGSGPSKPVEWSHSVLHGPQWSYYVAGPKPPGIAAGVAFRPGGAAAVMGIPMSALTDQHIPLRTLWGARGDEIHEQLMAVAAEPMKVFRILERHLLARIKRPLLMHPAVAQALASSPARVFEVQRESGHSAKHFIALFRDAVGVTPKHYFRIQRFNQVARSLAAGAGARLVDVAASAGYSDQAHLTREFREFTGLTPSRYRPAAPDRPLHHAAPVGPGIRGRR